MSIILSPRQLELIAKALAEPRRMDILKQVGASEDPTASSDVQKAQNVTPATLSHHIRELANAELLTISRIGKFMHIRVNRTILNAYLAQLAKI